MARRMSTKPPTTKSEEAYLHSYILPHSEASRNSERIAASLKAGDEVSAQPGDWSTLGSIPRRNGILGTADKRLGDRLHPEVEAAGLLRYSSEACPAY